MNEGKLRIQADRGAKAHALLQNELLQEAFTKIEAKLVDEWEGTTAEEAQRREDAWRSLKLLKNLKSQLTRIVTDGSAASKELLQVKNPSILARMNRK